MADMSDLTVLMPTFNRAEVLRTTLEAMCQVRRGELRVRFVVIDNASTDGTPELLRELAGRLPLTVLREPLAGKCNALNRALRDAPLGELVVFTDDDVTPDPSWFEAIVAISQRWPQHAVFGGRIVPGWPSGVKQPFWALGQQQVIRTDLLFVQGLHPGRSGRALSQAVQPRREVLA